MSKRGNTKVQKTTGGLLLTLFFFSGVCGLAFPLAVVHMMRHVLGPPLFALVSILATFLGGVALGSYSAGHCIDVQPGPLKIYGILEGSLGLYYLVFPFMIRWITPVYTVLYRNGGLSFHTSLLVRYLVFSPLLLIPAVLIGATWPVMGSVFHGRRNGIGRDMGRVFGIYALGGCVGALSAGLFMLPGLGAATAIRLCAGIDVMICTAAVALFMKGESGQVFESEQGNDRWARHLGPKAYTGIQWTARLGYGIALFGLMVYVVMLLRLLMPVRGAGLFSPFLIIPASMLGLALGSLIPSRFIDRITDPVLILGMLEIVVGLLILLMGHLIGGFPHLFTLMIEKGGRFPWSFRSIISLTPLLSVALSSILLGICLPLVCRISAKGIETIGTTTGVVFSIMALGALFGMAGGMGILFFGIGIIKGTQCAAWTFLLIGTLIIVLGTPLSVVRKTSLILLVIGIAAASLYYPPHQEMPLFRENTGRLSPFSGRDFNSTGENRPSRILASKNEIFSALHIAKGHGDISLLINGTTVCSLPRDLSSRILTGHIPLLFHENPREVLLLGLECGITLHALEQHPVSGLDCVEIHPQICEASDLFHQFHQGVLEDPRIKMIHDDARHYLAFTRRNYDVIICQPCASPGAIPDLFTEEFFQQCRRRLSPGGIAALHIPAQGMKEESFRSILSAWHRVFPFAILWETSLGREYLITGSDRQMRWNDVLIDDRIQRPGIASDCTAIHVVDPLVDIVSLFIMGGRDLPSYCRQAEPLSDDHALREAVMFQHFEDHPAEGLLEELQPYRGRGIEDVVPCIQDPAHSPLRERLQRVMEARHCLARAYGALVRGELRNTVMPIVMEAMEKAPRNREVVQFYADTLLVTAKEHFERRQYDMALWTLKEIMHAMPDHMEATYLLGRTYYTMGLIEQARGEYEKVVACWPDDEEVRCRLGMAYLNSGWIDLAIDQFNRAIRFDPLYAEPHLYLGAAYFKKDLLDQAIEEYGNALAIRPDYADAHYNLGIACLKSGLIDEAITAWKEVIRIRPDDVKARYNLAMAYYNHGALDESMAQLQEILRIRPDFVQARSLLNLINQAQGR